MLVPLLLAAALPLTSPADPSPIVGGSVVAECGWPNVVALGGACTGTLVHPRVVVYAAHCGGGSEVAFAENAIDGPIRTAATTFCKQFPREDGQLGRDFAFCVLEEPQLGLPIVPPLMGCEVAQLTEGAEVVVVGFGLDEDGMGGIKRELTTTFHRIENDEAFIGGGGKDACSGDSGGPAFLRVPDPGGGPDTWRLFGIVSHGDLECLEGTWYGLMHVGMEWFESESGFDLTPCTDADGTWNPGPRCTDFPVELADADGRWPEGCHTSSLAGPGQTCGEPFDFSVDDVPPQVELTRPAEAIELDTDPDRGSAAVVIEVEASDPGGWGIDEVRLLIDGVSIPSGFDGAPPYTFEANFPPGVYEVAAVAIDLAGNTASTEWVTVAVDEPLPSPPPPLEDAVEDGCGCRSTPDGPVEAGTALMLLLLGWRRRDIEARS